MFHRVKIEDQPKDQPSREQPRDQQPKEQQQPSFLPPRAEENRPAVEERQRQQRSFIQAGESIINENNKPEAGQAQAPQAPVKREAPVQVQPARPTQIQTQQPQQQKKEAAPMNNPQRDFDRTEAAQDSQAEQAQSRSTIPGGYQAANQTARIPGGYPGAYPGYNVKPAATNATETARSAGAVLTIGRGITLSGEIEACEHLVVEGNVEAALKGAKMLDIAESGTFYGAVEIEKATIAGRFEGDLTVNGRLTIRSTGSITGSISYKELEVESGAVLDGRITPLRAKEDAARKNSGKEASTTANKARDFRASVQPEAGNEGLFGDKAAAAE